MNILMMAWSNSGKPAPVLDGCTHPDRRYAASTPFSRLIQGGVLAAWVFMLAACETFAPLDQRIDQAGERARETTNEVLSDVALSRPLVKSHDEPYLDDQRIAYEDAVWLNERVEIRVTELPLNIVLAKALEQLNVSPSVVFSADVTNTKLPVTLEHKGLFREFLDRLAEATGYGWEHKNDTLYWMAEITRRFDISRMPGDVNFSMETSEPGSSALASGGTGSVDASPGGGGDISIEGGGTFWDDLETNIGTFVPDSVQYTIDRSTSTVLVQGPADLVRRVGRYINALNRWLERQVLLEIQVVQVLLDDQVEFGIDWNLVQTQIQETVDAYTTGSFGRVGGASLTVRLGGGSSLHEVVISALEDQGETSIQNSPRIIAMNGQAAQLQVMDDRTIVASRSTTVTASVGTQSSIEPGTVSTGITVTILPKIVARQVLLNINILVSSLLNITNSGGQEAISLPHVQRNQFFQSANLNSGETLALGGLITEKGRDSGRTLPGTLFGKVDKEYSRIETVLLITPTLLDPPGQGDDLL